MSGLSTKNHSRQSAGLKYIYPVISRRAKGLSVGVNLNTNNACNWRCVYCQVPNLIYGTAEEINFTLLEQELRFFLQQILCGDFYELFNIPKQQHSIKDIAISGNGEPTSLKTFATAVDLIGQIATEYKIFPRSDFVLITNGSLVHKPVVKDGLKLLNNYKGQIWFKLDSATKFGINKINNSKQSINKILENIKLCTTLCDTRLQTCMIEYLPIEAEESERKAYLELLKEIKRQQINLHKIMLYTLARPSLQPEANLLKKPEANKINQFANQLRMLDYKVSLSL